MRLTNRSNISKVSLPLNFKKNMKKILVPFILLFAVCTARGQLQSVLTLSPEQVEALFIEKNLELIAEKLNIDIADAAIAQAKLWDNPSLTVGGFNLWSTESQREGDSEVIPPLFGSFGRNTQFSVELSQMIQLAGKRSKLVGMERISKDIAVAQFEDVLRGLKAELRRSVCETAYLESYRNVLESQAESLSRLIGTYSKQVAQGNIARGELLRLQAALFEVDSEINEVQTELNGCQALLKTLLNADPAVTILIINSDPAVAPLQNIDLGLLFDTAAESRPDVTALKLETRYHEKSLAYEKAQRIPDLSLGVEYDRRGGVWRDFVGFSVGVDIPLFNRNQGAIRAARISGRQSGLLAQQQQSAARNEVAEAYQNYAQSYNFYNKVKADPIVGELDVMLGVYAKNLLEKNISMLEYIDFMDTYKSAKQTWLNARKNVCLQFEELQYAVGSEIK